jgi:hypothetical protein
MKTGRMSISAREKQKLASDLEVPMVSTGRRRSSSYAGGAGSFPKCSKPACVCAQPGEESGGRQGKGIRGKRKWNQKKEEVISEVYVPSINN